MKKLHIGGLNAWKTPVLFNASLLAARLQTVEWFLSLIF